MRAVLFLALAAASAFAQDLSTGPQQLIITYRCPPPRRAAFRQFMAETGIRRFEHWKQDGLLKDYRFLFNWYVDVDTWDAMAVLSFPDYAAVAKWKDVERATPGGLSRDALDMAWPLNTISADLISHDAITDAHDPALSVYLIVPYDAASTPPLRSESIASYSVFTNRYPGGKRWQSLLMIEYKDVDAFSRRPQIKPGREPVIAEPLIAH